MTSTMGYPNIEVMSLDITNQCQKECPFCYNKSGELKTGRWKGQEVIDFALSCVQGGVRSISLGGGEPFEHPEIFEIIKKLYSVTYLTVTTNGLPLEKSEIRERLVTTHPDKIHISIHRPDNDWETQRVMKQLQWLKSIDIVCGVNLLVSSHNIDSAKETYRNLRTILTAKQIILLPMRYQDSPTPFDLSRIAGSKPFQSASCLTGCRRPENFVSITWDKKVGFCSFTDTKLKLRKLTYEGLLETVSTLGFTCCI